jgi:hypothetical protein
VLASLHLTATAVPAHHPQWVIRSVGVVVPAEASG